MAEPDRSTTFLRHFVIGGAGGLLAVVLRLASEWHWMHAWNRAFADVALLYLVVTIALGPIARLAPGAARALPWRRELGVWTVLFSAVHVWIVLADWVEWDLTRFWTSAWPHGIFFDSAFAMGNLVGLAALLYGMVLLATSNDAAQRVLGSGWKFLQRGATTHFILVALHAAYFLFLHFETTFHKPAVPENWLRTPFMLVVALLLVLQAAAFLKTVRAERHARRARR